MSQRGTSIILRELVARLLEIDEADVPVRDKALALRMAARDAQIFERLLGPVENKPKPEHGVDPRLDRVSHPISAA
jgi:hypothetical protein